MVDQKQGKFSGWKQIKYSRTRASIFLKPSHLLVQDLLSGFDLSSLAVIDRLVRHDSLAGTLWVVYEADHVRRDMKELVAAEAAWEVTK